MSKEQARALLKRIQDGTATSEDRKKATIAFAVISANILVNPGA